MAMYSRALGAVSSGIGDPVQSRSSEVLCAVMVLSICQVSFSFIFWGCRNEGGGGGLWVDWVDRFLCGIRRFVRDILSVRRRF